MQNVRQVSLVVLMFIFGVVSGLLWLGATGASGNLLVLMSLFVGPVLMLGLQYLTTGPIWPNVWSLGFIATFLCELFAHLNVTPYSNEWASMVVWIFPIVWLLFWLLIHVNTVNIHTVHNISIYGEDKAPDSEGKPKPEEDFSEI